MKIAAFSSESNLSDLKNRINGMTSPAIKNEIKATDRIKNKINLIDPEKYEKYSRVETTR
ncbi:hypothetical protein OO013_13020 [Mangrovivirga sp. M17]|uniref:Uncharacterized protein n=1 Tax=Mangrovivirga halotolerans TaxID=2993936 RepID=A0ABT3RT90_9BACT|nr:hypothetical protein [Mangrovivirga halotolerans]MCX2744798.1 hypothetical protein [Mangrovivirga halotolerans]